MKVREYLIKFQNNSEKDFGQKKSVRNIIKYLAALIIFFLSTLYAGLSFPIRSILKGLRSKSDGTVVDINSSNFRMLIETNDSVILNFTAHWCGPCVLMGNTLKEVAKDHKETLVGKINVDTNSRITKEFNIKGVPQFVLIRSGQEVRRHAGPLTKLELEQFISA